MSRDEYWQNADGLTVGFDKRSSAQVAGVTNAGGSNLETAKVVLTLADLEDTDVITAASFEGGQSIRLPRGSYITAARVIPTVTADSAGDAATLDIGTYDVDYTSITVDDANGIDADIAEAALAVGTVTLADGALVAGTVAVGATSNTDVVIIAGFEAEAFTVGEIILEVDYVKPSGSANLTNDYQIAV